MRATTVIATLTTPEASDEVARILEANGIEHTVEEPSEPRLGTMRTSEFFGVASTDNYVVVVAAEDEGGAREALQGVFGSDWFLVTPDGRPYHSFEAASADVLRKLVSGHPEVGDWSLRDVAYLADGMARHGWKTVYEAFHEHHLLRERERLGGARGLDDWAQLCGCGHIEQSPPA